MHILLNYQRSRECQMILAFFPDGNDFLSTKCRARPSFTLPLELLVTKDVVNDTLSAMGYPELSMICLNQ